MKTTVPVKNHTVLEVNARGKGGWLKATPWPVAFFLLQSHAATILLFTGRRLNETSGTLQREIHRPWWSMTIAVEGVISHPLFGLFFSYKIYILWRSNESIFTALYDVVLEQSKMHILSPITPLTLSKNLSPQFRENISREILKFKYHITDRAVGVLPPYP